MRNINFDLQIHYNLGITLYKLPKVVETRQTENV